MSRYIPVAALLLLTPALAPAQFSAGFGGRFQGLPGLPVLGGPGAFIPTPYYAYQRTFVAGVPGGPTVGYTQRYAGYGMSPWGISAAYYYGTNGYGYGLGAGFPSVNNGSMSGGVRNPAVEAVDQGFARAQQDAAAARVNGPVAAARPQIAGAWDYENRGPVGKLPEPTGGASVAGLNQALATDDPDALASGELLNQILYAVWLADTKGAKLPSSYLRPDMLALIRFGGSPAADALNLLRGGKLEFPAAFSDPAVSPTRAALDREFAAAANLLKANKPVDPATAGRLAAAVKAAHEKLLPVVKDLSFEDAIAARRFVNQLEGVQKVLREPSAAGLLNPKWRAEGASVSDLTRHMAKHKLLFGPADKGDAEVYATLHRGLAAYYFGLSQAGAKK